MYYQCRFEQDTPEGIETTVGWVANVKGLEVGKRVTLKNSDGFWLVKSISDQGITEKEFLSLKTKSREWDNNI